MDTFSIIFMKSGQKFLLFYFPTDFTVAPSKDNVFLMLL